LHFPHLALALKWHIQCRELTRVMQDRVNSMIDLTGLVGVGLLLL
jgi:amino acid permease